MSIASDPSLIDIVVGTFPGLYLIGVGDVTICEIKAETLKTMSDPVKGNKCTVVPWLVRCDFNMEASILKSHHQNLNCWVSQ